MSVYQLEKLMDETRRIAAEYRASTGATLPVSGELAKFDAMRLLGLTAADGSEKAVDAILATASGVQKLQIKARVIFDPQKSGYRVGQLNLQANWDWLLLVLMDERYETTEIYRLPKAVLVRELGDARHLKKARGAISVRKFKAIAERCWPAKSE